MNDPDAIRDLPGTEVIIYTVAGGVWRGRVDHVVADSSGHVPLAVVTDAGVIVPWIAVDAIIPQPAPVSP